jgi:hypothetical protein
MVTIAGLRELDVLIADNLDAIAPRVAEIQEAAIQRSDTGRFQRVAGLPPARCAMVAEPQGA